MFHSAQHDYGGGLWRIDYEISIGIRKSNKISVWAKKKYDESYHEESLALYG